MGSGKQDPPQQVGLPERHAYIQGNIEANRLIDISRGLPTCARSMEIFEDPLSCSWNIIYVCCAMYMLLVPLELNMSTMVFTMLGLDALGVGGCAFVDQVMLLAAGRWVDGQFYSALGYCSFSFAV